METCNVALTFDSSSKSYGVTFDETSSPVLPNGSICFLIFYKMRLGDIFFHFDFWHSWELNGLDPVTPIYAREYYIVCL